MSEDEFVSLGVQYVGNVVKALLIGYHSIETGVHKHIAQFFHHVVLVVAHDGIAQFKCLFYSVRT